MLSSITVRTKSGRLIPLVLAATLLAACSGRVSTTPPAPVQSEATASADYYLQQMQQSSDDSKADWQLLAIRALLREGKLPQAADLLGQLPSQLSEAQQLEQRLVSAELEIARHAPQQAQAILTKLDVAQLSQAQQLRYYQAVIAAAQGKTTLAQIRAYIALQPLLTQEKQRKANIDATWAALSTLTPADLNGMVINANEDILRGWLDLLRLYQDNRQDPALLKAAIKDWQTRYPNNPAATLLPSALDNILHLQSASTASIALLLPLNGQAKVFSDAIEAGFNAAKNGAFSQNSAPTAAAATDNGAPASSGTLAAATTPSAPADVNAAGAVSPSAQGTDAAAPAAPNDSAALPPLDAAGDPIAPSVSPGNPDAHIQVYDTSSQPLPALLSQAQQAGASLVVGPLLKNNVDQLNTLSTPLNILALNQPEQVQNHPNICYFALSPEDEARDAARHIWAQGKRTPLLLIPRSPLGDRVAKAFATEWQSLGGSSVLQQTFGSSAELRSTINGGTGIRLTGQPVSVAPAQPASVTIAGLTIPAPVQPPVASGGGVDAVYIIATPAEITLIKPMIDLANGTHNGIGLYASSRSYQAGAGPDFRLEMEGVQFSDIPLLAGSDPAILQQAPAQYRNDYSLMRLYAMGADAWTLANHFAQLRQIPGFQVQGATGTLSANDNCVIQRKLPWLQYQKGSIVPVQ
ncbi:penicillin-binding protein activator [Edwardsiella piscicida]|uniref:penicillin-binding protein activator n=1 Tax=Edwardsiella piscicida TaxID=1263550 RepID=UPI00084C3B4E|nr:penicillin-binding protein activator [Edwardsiella piscicida]AOP42039.1 penicillin-binding protein activator [Edwardsiella piscicida]EKS7766655.1 penicillin-binding protein activator [Edwardsiella piscicida]EKS7813656.1 penicillin-binding protein activator [Edwardsiella piscicida]UCQ21607.1 penicillin-binding protein activator [Edwardsiella piscicida]UCQ31792.1 penicillin-binding protein activator [Edwardsiella piscicida]